MSGSGGFRAQDLVVGGAEYVGSEAKGLAEGGVKNVKNLAQGGAENVKNMAHGVQEKAQIAGDLAKQASAPALMEVGLQTLRAGEAAATATTWLAPGVRLPGPLQRGLERGDKRAKAFFQEALSDSIID
jgi:hypothetical protein